ncbi:acetate kinase [Thiotrichales bacterium 19S3-7]|nr:acetate kinase [Thiotrichales bacterium 19S3-7]MCF6802068.1 acetate kinase [Thiotrichales bacterium 19S3-11]
MSEYLILTLNCGSSSIKFAVISPQSQNTILEGQAERIAQPDTLFRSTYLNNPPVLKQLDCASYETVFKEIKSHLAEHKLLDAIQAVGHRVVHGGHLFKNATIINSTVIDTIRSLIPLAPLHNPHNLSGIEFCQKVFHNLTQVAVFDTAFHQSIPQTNYVYALPYDMYEKHHIRKYGFHGISHQYLSSKADQILHINGGNYISLHLGNGCSISAIKQSKSFDTSMGFTPLDGLVMGSRSGSIDPGIMTYLSNQLNLDIKQIDHILNKQSGLLGLCQHSDMREIEALIDKNDKKAKLALNIFCQRIAFFISAYFAYFEKLDAIIFSGGIGEHSNLVRKTVINKIKNLGFMLDQNNNKQNGNESNYHINAFGYKTVLVIPTNEELMIAKETEKLITH